MKNILMALPALMITFGCSTNHPIKPAGENVTVSRNDPGKDCKEVGPVEGRVKHVKDKFEDALEDLKLDASRKGANFVQIQQTGALGQSVAGVAYFCN